MRSLPRKHVSTKGLLIAAAILSIVATGVFAPTAMLGQQYPSLAFAQQELGIPSATTSATDNATGGGTTAADTTSATTGATTSGGGGANKLAGIIASLQLAPDRIAPEWIVAGYWEIDSTGPLLQTASSSNTNNNQSQPTITNFTGRLEMMRFDNGTALHTHTFSDFKPSALLFQGENTTTINGTMTVTLREGPVQNVPVTITLQNNLISIAINPVPTNNHFGPNPITGMILTPEHLQDISRLITRSLGQTTEGG